MRKSCYTVCCHICNAVADCFHEMTAIMVDKEDGGAERGLLDAVARCVYHLNLHTQLLLKFVGA